MIGIEFVCILLAIGEFNRDMTVLEMKWCLEYNTKMEGDEVKITGLYVEDISFVDLNEWREIL